VRATLASIVRVHLLYACVGLDAAAAIEVIQHLRHIADAGIPVICSLLQPSQDIFDLFDSILILNKREMTYFGTTKEVLGYFEKVVGFTCPEGKNVAEFLRMFVDSPTINPVGSAAAAAAAAVVVAAAIQMIEQIINLCLLGLVQSVEVHTSKGSVYKMDQVGLGVVPVEEFPSVYKYSRQGQAVCIAQTKPKSKL
jgi:hypothetical protein